MSTKTSSTYLQPPAPPGVSQQTNQQPDQQQSVARLHSVAAHSSTASTSNIFHSLSSIHRSNSILPAPPLDIDLASTAGLQLIRPDTHPEAFVPVPPDGGWGWVVVAAAFLTNLIIDGICVSFGIMVTDLVEHFNTSVANVMLLGSLLVGVYQIVGPVAAGLVNRFGCRSVGVGGSILATVSMFASAFMPSIELMIVSYGVFAGAAFGLLHLPSIVCVSFYFDSRRTLAIGLTSVGTPVGAIIFAPLTELLLSKYGWSNTLILFAGMLLNCTAFAALYRPLTPALILTPMKPAEAQAIKSLLLLAAGDEDAEISVGRLGGASLSVVASQRDLRDQPVLEEAEEEDEDMKEQKPENFNSSEDIVLQTKVPQIQLTTITEGPEEAERIGGNVSKPKEVVKVVVKKPHHYRHHRRQKPRKASSQLLQQLHYRGQEGREEIEGGAKSDGSGAADSEESSQASTCDSSCEEGASHWDSRFDTASEIDEPGSENEAHGDKKRPLKKPSRKQTAGGKESTRGRSKRTGSTDECIFSAPSLNQPSNRKTSRLQNYWKHSVVQRRENKSECRLSRTYSRPIPRRPVVHIANASVSRRRSESIAVCQLAQSHVSSFGSALFASAVSRFGIGGAGGVTGNPSIEELADTAPVIVELPHESIAVEDYARPLYRKDIFFPGSVRWQIGRSSASIAAAAQDNAENLQDQVTTSQTSIAAFPDRIRHRKTTVGASTFGSSIFFGDNVPLPLINEASVHEGGNPMDVNWTGSCLMSLTKIPLPDVFDKEGEDGEDSEGKIWDGLKSKMDLNLTGKPTDGIYRVPRTLSLCGWWLCWQTQGEPDVTLDESAGKYRMKDALKPRLILIRRCVYLPKSMLDVLMTMMNLSLLKSTSFAIFCAGSAIAMLGVYVPLFFVCDLADSFGIPKSQSAFLVTFYGGASAVSRLASSWIAGRPKVSTTLLTAIALIICGISVCVVPYWGSLIGQMLIMIVFGLTISPFLSLASIIICDILGLEALTNAYGVVTMVRGIASTAGSPVAGLVVSSTQTYSAALLLAGATIIVGGILYVIVVFYERSKFRKMFKAETDAEEGWQGLANKFLERFDLEKPRLGSIAVTISIMYQSRQANFQPPRGSMVNYKQEMPPPGGFAPLDFAYKGVRKNLNGLYVIAALYACSYIGIKLRHWQRERNEAIANENKEVRLALTPFLLAEQQRMFLKQLIKNREYETELMKDVPGWEVGHWHNTPVYYNPRGLWCEPNLYEFYAHLSRRQTEHQLTVHFDY